MMEPFPSVSQAYRLLLQEQLHKELVKQAAPLPDSMAFASDHNSSHSKHHRFTDIKNALPLLVLNASLGIFVTTVKLVVILLKDASKSMDIHLLQSLENVLLLMLFILLFLMILMLRILDLPTLNSITFFL